jgi:hypothetical protein
LALLAGFCLVVGLPLAAMAGPTPNGTPDTDGDGVENAFDNCSARSNANQGDKDHDACGDLCDGDFNQDGTAGTVDLGIFNKSKGASSGNPAYNPGADMNCDGTIGTPDLGLFTKVKGSKAGPSGISTSNRNLVACPL